MSRLIIIQTAKFLVLYLYVSKFALSNLIVQFYITKLAVYNLHFTICIAKFSFHNFHCTVCIAKFPLCILHCLIWIIKFYYCKLHHENCIVNWICRQNVGGGASWWFWVVLSGFVLFFLVGGFRWSRSTNSETLQNPLTNIHTNWNLSTPTVTRPEIMKPVKIQ